MKLSGNNKELMFIIKQILSKGWFHFLRVCYSVLSLRRQEPGPVCPLLSAGRGPQSLTY